VCIALCTIVARNTAQNRADNFPSYLQTIIIAPIMSIWRRGLSIPSAHLLQCFDTAGLVTGMASRNRGRKRTDGGTGKPKFTWRTATDMQILITHSTTDE